MANLTDVEIRKAIKNSINTALEDLYGGEEVKVLSFWAISQIGKSLALLKAAEGDNAGYVQGWMIGSAGISRERPDLKDGHIKGSLRQKGPGIRNIIKKYRVWAFKELDFGSEEGVEDDENSETLLVREIDYVADYLSKTPQLGINNSLMLGHSELQFQNIGVFNAGELIVNVAQGTLDIHYSQIV